MLFLLFSTLLLVHYAVCQSGSLSSKNSTSLSDSACPLPTIDPETNPGDVTIYSYPGYVTLTPLPALSVSITYSVGTIFPTVSATNKTIVSTTSLNGTISPSSGFVTSTRSATNGTTNSTTKATLTSSKPSISSTRPPATTASAPPPPPPPPPPPTPRVHCTINDHFFYFTVNLQTTGWDDGNYGRSILDNERNCGIVTGWTWEAGGDYDFGGGVKADHYGRFNLPELIGNGCIEWGIATALGLNSGSVICVLN
ncbi:hypothetical protein GP486_005312 [Trichoglossum hirsutum]|uniref:Uncharacterized protein n=1 Tax=Trichoglossum hirsutum TaxID=265104 RepID=A0A9P8RMG3_9PEZI|nr:hypothetical protein GP486_005312 [Trichoglossum hirsutum]